MLAARSDLIVAVAAIYRSAFTRLKRYFSVFATLGAYCGKHFTAWPVAATASLAI